MTAAKSTEGGKNVPKTLAIIMDGNRRFARSRSLPLMKGHELGYEKLKEVVQWVKSAGVETLIVYAFSTENWKRTSEEVSYLMRLLEQAVIERADELLREKVRIIFIGEKNRFSERVREAMGKLEEETKEWRPTLVVALSYGGRAEIIEAVKKAASEKKGEELLKMTEEEFSKYLSTASFPDPDLIIRTSGELRTSNFLPWQSAYSEWYFTKTFWPAFEKKEFEHILADYAARERRNGK